MLEIQGIRVEGGTKKAPCSTIQLVSHEKA